MIVNFDKSFLKSLEKLKNQPAKKKIETLINELEKTDSFSKIRNCKKLSGYKAFYRIRVGDYRIGLEEISSAEIMLIIIAHRKEIYDKFP